MDTKLSEQKLRRPCFRAIADWPLMQDGRGENRGRGEKGKLRNLEKGIMGKEREFGFGNLHRINNPNKRPVYIELLNRRG